MTDLSKVPLNEYGHVQTRDGRPVRLLCKDLRSDYTVAAAVEEKSGGGEFVSVFHHDGEYHNQDCSHLMDLIPVPRKVKVKGWVNVYPGGPHHWIYDDKEGADRYARSDRIACIEIDHEVTEGEGL